MLFLVCDFNFDFLRSTSTIKHYAKCFKFEFYSWMILAILVLFKTYPCSQLPFFCIFLFMIPQFQPLISTKIDHGAKCILVGTEVFLVCDIPVFLCFLIYFCHFFITPTNTSWFSFIKVFLPALLLIFCIFL